MDTHRILLISCSVPPPPTTIHIHPPPPPPTKTHAHTHTHTHTHHPFPCHTHTHNPTAFDVADSHIFHAGIVASGLPVWQCGHMFNILHLPPHLSLYPPHTHTHAFPQHTPSPSVCDLRLSRSPCSCCSRWQSSQAVWMTTGSGWSPHLLCRPGWDPRWRVASAGCPRSAPGGRLLWKHVEFCLNLLVTEDEQMDKRTNAHYNQWHAASAG